MAEQVFGGAAISRGRIFFVSTDAVYAVGPKQRKTPTGFAVDEPAVDRRRRARFRAGLADGARGGAGPDRQAHRANFDSRGRFLREEKADVVARRTQRAPSLTGRSPPRRRERAGAHQGGRGRAHRRGARAVVGRCHGPKRSTRWRKKRSRAGWVNAAGPVGPLVVATLDGQRSCRRPRRTRLFKRGRVFIGPVEAVELHDEADVRAPTRRRMMADVGITVQRYSLVLYGTTQRLKLEPWEPETQRLGRRCRSPGSRTPGTPSSCASRICRTERSARGQGVAAGEPSRPPGRKSTRPIPWQPPGCAVLSTRRTSTTQRFTQNE